MAGGQQSAEPQTLECEADLSWDNELITAAMKCCLSPAHAPVKQWYLCDITAQQFIILEIFTLQVRDYTYLKVYISYLMVNKFLWI